MGDPVQLTDLDVITRYSIAVRSATADRDELLQTLRSDLAWLERGRPRSTAFTRAPAAEAVDYDEPEVDEYQYDDAVEEEPATRAPIRRMAMPPTRRAPARKTAAKSTATKRTAAKKTAAKKATTRRDR
jgi:hypothetical protein